MFSLGFLLILNHVYAQGNHTYIEYTGNASATNIQGIINYRVTINSGQVSYLDIELCEHQSNSIRNNAQTINNYAIATTPSVTIPSPGLDAYGNYKYCINVQGPFYVFDLDISYDASTSVDIPAFFNVDYFPVSNIPPDVVVYLNPSSDIQSNNSTIQAAAQTITAGCYTIPEAVEKIAQWIDGNITYASEIDQDALSVYTPRTVGGNYGRFGNCTGFTNLSIAFLRSLGIPARYVGGEVLPFPFFYPFLGGSYITAGTSGPGAHAIHEIYYPGFNDWVRGDGQSSVHFTNTNFIKIGQGPNSEAQATQFQLYYPAGSTLNYSISRNIYSTIGNVNDNYVYKSHYNFQGPVTNPQILVAVEDLQWPVGIYDDVDITSGNQNFTPGDNVSYTAEFTSGWGDTWATEWDWSLILYHSGGTYIYAEALDLPDLGNYSIWNFTSSTSIPDYEWNRDPAGNIFGKVTAMSTDNNGEYNYAEMSISLNYKPPKPSLSINSISSDAISIDYATPGATSYDIYYGNSDLLEGFTGTYAFEGNSPVDVNDHDSYTLSNLESPTYITVRASNAYGESDLAEPIAFCEYARLPYTTGFENGLDSYWSTKRDKSTNRVITTSSYGPHSGSSHLIMDGIPSQYYINSADLHLNLKNEKNVLLDFWWKEYGDETHSQDGIYISNDGGRNFVKVYDLQGSSVTNETWTNIILDLRDLANHYSLTLTDLFVVRFQQYDNYSISTDGFAFDDVRVIRGISSKVETDALLCLNTNPNYLYISDNNYGSSPYFSANEWTHGGYKTTKRSLINFDLSGIPPSAIIESAKLSLYAYNDPNNWHMNFTITGDPGFKLNACYLRRITDPWNESTVTWNNQPSTTTIHQVSLDESTSHGEDYLNIDITALIQDMVENPDQSNGLMLILKSEIKYAQMALCSSDHPDESKHPVIEIKYSIPTIQTPPIQASKDAMVLLHTKPGYEYCANTNYGSYDRLVADEWTSSGYRTNKNGLIDFDLSDIPATAAVTEALLNLRACDPQPNDEYKQMSNLSTGNPGFKPNASWLRKIVTPWEENQVTYNTQPVTSEINRVYLKTSETYDQDYINIDVTDLIQDKISSPSVNHGMLLDLDYGIKYSRMVFASSDHANNSLHPELIINYYNTEKYYQIPFSEQGNTCLETDNWDVQYSDGKDKAYLVYLPQQTEIDVTLCSDYTDYDTKLEIFNLDKTRTGFYNDDDNTCEWGLQSSIYGALLPSGYYYIIVDGYGGDCGNYELSVTEVGGLKSEIFHMGNISTGDEDKAEKIFEMLIYPNPADEELMVKSPNEIHGVRIFDLSGRIIYNNKIITIDGTLTINTAEFNPGIYIIFVDMEHSTVKQKIIISR